jgi:hypothetical protein
MRALFQAIDDFLRGRGVFAPEAPLAGRLRWLVVLVITCGPFYGVIMGTYSGLSAGRAHQLLYSGLKVPLLLLATFLLCLPSFFVINTIAGLREDFGRVLRAVIGTQSCVTVVLAGLAPLTVVWYASSQDYQLALLFNALMFGVASLASQVVVRRYYGPLIRRSRRHRQLLRVWLLLYMFVGIQMAWVLRPFIGDPNLPVAFFRPEAWGNAYVVVARLLVHAVNSAGAGSLLWSWTVVGILLLVAVFVAFYSYHIVREKHCVPPQPDRNMKQ